MDSRTYDTISLFKSRLSLLIEDTGLSMSAFAKTCKIDRSTLSQILSPNSYRLPRLENAMIIAQKYGVSVDWLLGLDNNPQKVQDLSLEIKSDDEEHISFDEQLDFWFEESLGQKIRYSPSTLPELLKTKAVNTFEYKGYDILDHRDLIDFAKKRLEYQRTGETDLEVCNSFQAIESFVRGEGAWRGLSRKHRSEQVDTMIELSKELYPNFRWYLFDIRKNYLVPLYIFGRSRGCVFMGESYFVFSQVEHIKTLIQNFDNLIKNAIHGPTEIEKFLLKLKREHL